MTNTLQHLDLAVNLAVYASPRAKRSPSVGELRGWSPWWGSNPQTPPFEGGAYASFCYTAKERAVGLVFLTPPTMVTSHPLERIGGLEPPATRAATWPQRPAELGLPASNLLGLACFPDGATVASRQVRWSRERHLARCAFLSQRGVPGNRTRLQELPTWGSNSCRDLHTPNLGDHSLTAEQARLEAPKLMQPQVTN